MTKQERLNAALRLVAMRCQRAETEAADRRATLEQQLPAYAALQAKAAACGAEAAVAAASGHPQQAQTLLAQVEEIGAEAADLLRAAGINATKLTPQYTCEACHDSGYTKAGLCACVSREMQRLQRGEISRATPLQLCRFEGFSLDRYSDRPLDGSVSPRQVMTGILADCKAYAENFGAASPSLLMLGDAGLGKTHLALSIAAQVLEGGFDAVYVSAAAAFSVVGDDRFGAGPQMLQSMLNADLLVLDDLGTEYMDNYRFSRLYELLNARLGSRPTIVTTNFVSQAELCQRYTEKLASRLVGYCHLLRFLGTDQRLAGNPAVRALPE